MQTDITRLPQALTSIAPFLRGNNANSSHIERATAKGKLTLRSRMAHGTFLSPTYTLHIYKEKKLTPLLHPLPMIPLLRLSPGRLTSIRAALHEHGYSNTSAVTLTTQADIVIPPHPEVESCGFCKPTDQDGQGVLPKYLYSCAGSKCTPVADKNQNGTGQATFPQFFSSFCSPMQGIGQAIKRKIRSP